MYVQWGKENNKLANHNFSQKSTYPEAYFVSIGEREKLACN